MTERPDFEVCENATLFECRCGESLGVTDFRCASSLREFEISGFCQLCQDLIWLALSVPTGDEPSQAYRLRSGLVFAASEADREVVCIPFVFGAPGRGVGWDLRRIVRVGHPLPSLDLALQLAAIGRILDPHQVSITDATDPTDPVLARFGGTALVLGFQPRIMGAFARMCPALSEFHCNTVDFSWKDVSAEVDLATVVEQLGLDPGYVPGSPPPSALRQAAWFVALLQLSSSEGGSVLDTALASHVRRVPVPPPSPASVH